MQAMDVVRACLNTHQDDFLAILAASHCFVSGEDNLQREQASPMRKLRVTLGVCAVSPRKFQHTSSKGALPPAAPGEAGRPLAITSFLAFGSSVG